MSSPVTSIKIGSHWYETGLEYFVLPYGDSVRKTSILPALRQLPNLKGASFGGSDLNDTGMEILCELPQLENLDLQDTQITNDGLCGLKKLKHLKHLRLKENPQLNNSCILHLKQVPSLQTLQIHDTSINQDGLDRLAGMPSLNDIVLSVHNGNYTYEKLLRLSLALPHCRILAKGQGEFLNGAFDGSW